MKRCKRDPPFIPVYVILEKKKTYCVVIKLLLPYILYKHSFIITERLSFILNIENLWKMQPGAHGEYHKERTAVSLDYT